MINRHLTPMPENHNLNQLKDLSRSIVPLLIDVNEYECAHGHFLALYTDSDSEPLLGVILEWENAVSSFVPVEVVEDS